MQKILFAIVLITASASSNAQKGVSEFSIYGAGGLSTLQYNLSAGSSTRGYGGSVGMGVTYFLSKKIGLVTGAELSMYQTKASLKDNFSGSYAAQGLTSAVDNSMIYTYTMNGYGEEQKALYMNIPLMLQYQKGKHTQWYVAGGAKIGLPLSTSYTTTQPYTLATKGYFSAEKRTYDNVPQHGFGVYDNQTVAGKKWSANMNCMAAFETGIKWRLGYKNALYTGVFIDYGVMNVQKNATRSLVAYAGDDPVNMYSLLESQVDNKSIAGKVIPLTVGIKLKLAFGRGKIQKPVAKMMENSMGKGNKQVIKKENQEKLADSAALEAMQAEERIQKQVEAARAQAVQEIQKPMVGYGLSQTKPSEYQIQDLNKKIGLLKQYPNLRVRIEGHTCNVGTNKVNYKIGMQRAEEAKAYMIAQGISSKRIIAVTLGPSKPLVPNDSEANRQKNRRVEAVIIE